MANNPLVYNTPATTAVNALTALLNNGYLAIYTGAQPALGGALSGTQLVQLTFGGTAFAGSAASGGVVTAVANAIGNGTAGSTGAAGYFALLESDDATAVLTGTVGTSGADLNLSTLAIVSGAVISCSSLNLTMAQT